MRTEYPQGRASPSPPPEGVKETWGGPAFPWEYPQGRASPSPPPEGVKETWGGPAFPWERRARQLGALLVLLMAGSAPADSPDARYRLNTPTAAYRVQPRDAWHLPAAGTHNPAIATRPHAQRIADAARAAGIDPELLHAVVKIESGYDAAAVSPKGARGLAQVMPATAERFGHDGLDAGARYLRHLIDRFGGDLPLALAAYNAGPGAVERHGGMPPYAETQAYVPRVLAEYAALRAERRRLPTRWQQGGAWRDGGPEKSGS